ncbi:hypothetical protein ACWGKQ_36835 [Streptomyces sp. NPDC054770]
MNVVRFEQDGDVGSIVLCDPPNRVSRQYADDLREAVHQAGESRIRALLVRAEGADFSLGGAAASDWRCRVTSSSPPRRPSSGAWR